MRGQRGIRALPGRLLLALALGALAVLAIPAVSFADHGHHHGNSNPAGTVKSFDQETGVLVIDLAEGGDIEGLVTEDTRIQCMNENERRHNERRHNRRRGHRATASDSGPGHDGSGDNGDNSGPGNSGDNQGEQRAEEPGEDNHGEGNEPGEDNHGEPGEDNNENNDNDNENQGRNEECVAQLVAGTTVRRAELELENGVATFEKVSLEG